MRQDIDLKLKDTFINKNNLSEEEINKLKDNLKLLAKISMKNFINKL